MQHFVERQNAFSQLKENSAKPSTRPVIRALHQPGRSRSFTQPVVLATYFGVFRFTDVLWIFINRMVTIGRLYREFSHTEIEKIQKAMTFFRAG